MWELILKAKFASFLQAYTLEETKPEIYKQILHRYHTLFWQKQYEKYKELRKIGWSDIQALDVVYEMEDKYRRGEDNE